MDHCPRSFSACAHRDKSSLPIRLSVVFTLAFLFVCSLSVGKVVDASSVTASIQDTSVNGSDFKAKVKCFFRPFLSSGMRSQCSEMKGAAQAAANITADRMMSAAIPVAVRSSAAMAVPPTASSTLSASPAAKPAPKSSAPAPSVQKAKPTSPAAQPGITRSELDAALRGIRAEILRAIPAGTASYAAPAPASYYGGGYSVPAPNTASTDYVAQQAAAVPVPWTQSGSALYYSGGNVGIGTTSPSARMHVIQPLGGVALTLQANTGINDTANLVFKNGLGDESASLELSGGGKDLTFWRSNGGIWSETLHILNSNGNVGIGTSTPAAMLDIVSETGSGSLSLTGKSGTALMTMRSYRNSSVTHGGIEVEAARGTATNPLPVNANDSLMSIRAGGWDGTSFYTPGADSSAAIDLSADENFTSTANRAGKIVFSTLGTGSDYKTGRLVIKGDGTIGMGLGANGNPSAALEVRSTNVATTSVLITGFSGSQTADILQLAKNSGATPGFVFTAAGNVGVGTASPSSKLHIEGVDNASTVVNLRTSSVSNDGGVINFKRFDNTNMGNITVSSAALSMRSYWNMTLGGGNGDASGSTLIVSGGTGYVGLNSSLYVMPSGGNVGIGTTTPAKKLSVSGDIQTGDIYFNDVGSVNHYIYGNSTARYIRMAGTGGSNEFRFGNQSGKGIEIYDTDNSVSMYTINRGLFSMYGPNNPNRTWQFSTSGTTWSMTPYAESNVTIGVSITGSNGSQTGGGSNGGNVTITGGDAGSGTAGNVLISPTYGKVGIGTTTPGSVLSVKATAGANPFTISSSSDAVMLTMLQNGNVGIGTTSPSRRLSVASDGTYSGYFAGRVGIGIQAPGHLLHVNGNAAVENTMYLGATSLSGILDVQTYCSGSGEVGGGCATNNSIVLHNAANGSDVMTGILFKPGQGDPSVAQIKAMYDSVGGSTARLSFLVRDSGGNLTDRLRITDTGRIGIGTTTPSAQLTNTGTVRFAALGSGGASLITDALGNVTVSSDERLKDVQGRFEAGLEQVLMIDPITYRWKSGTGYDTEATYAGFSAQDVQGAIPEAVSTDSRGFLTLADRPILAALVNAVKELAGKVKDAASWIAQSADHFKSKKVETDTLCIGNTCVTEQQLQDLLQKNSVAPAPAIVTPVIVDPVVSASNTPQTQSEADTQPDLGSGATNPDPVQAPSAGDAIIEPPVPVPTPAPVPDSVQAAEPAPEPAPAAPVVQASE